MVDGATQLTMGFLVRHPDAAAAVLEEQPTDVAAAFLAEVPARLGGPVLALMMPWQASRCLLEIDPDTAAGLIREMPHTLAATNLRQWPVAKREEILDRLPKRLALTLRILLGYPSTTAGAWMDPRPALLPLEGDAETALARLRREEGDVDGVVFAISREQKLEGRVRISALLRAPQSTSLSVLLEPAPSSIEARTDLLELKEHDAWDLPDPVPVLSREGRVVGVLRYSDLRRGLAASRDRENEAPGNGLIHLADGSWLGMARILESLLRFLPPARPPAPPENNP